MATGRRKERLSKEAWLELALDAVSRAGGARLRVDSLVEAVGVSKGSFYWHFESRDQFVLDLIDYWHAKYTLSVSTYLDAYEGGAEEKLHELMRMVFVEHLTRHDLAIRAWAIAEPALRQLVKRTDDFRLDYLRKLFSGIGFDDEGADLRSRVFLGEAAWEVARFRRMSKAERARNADAFFNLLIARTESRQ